MMQLMQAYAFVDACSKGAAKQYFAAHLGSGQVPTVKDFNTDQSEDLEKAEAFVDLLATVHDTLCEALRVRPRQTRLEEKDGKLEQVGSTSTSKGTTTKKKTTKKKSTVSKRTSKKKNGKK